MDMDFCHSWEINLKNVEKILDTATKTELAAAMTAFKNTNHKTTGATGENKIDRK